MAITRSLNISRPYISYYDCTLTGNIDCKQLLAFRAMNGTKGMTTNDTSQLEACSGSSGRLKVKQKKILSTCSEDRIKALHYGLY